MDRGSPELENTLRTVVVAFRLLGWVWMTLLVSLTLMRPPADLNTGIVVAAFGLASFWTMLTWYLARAHPDRLSSAVFFATDLIVALAIGAASMIANAEDFFHGGLPMSTVFVGALWSGMIGSFIGATALVIQQVAIHLIDDMGMVGAAGSVIFFAVAAIVGWTFSRLRQYDSYRHQVERALALEREQVATERAREKAAAAAHQTRLELVRDLHDSVLQTFHAIRLGADEPTQSRHLARRQERELRRYIAQWESGYDRSFKASLLEARDRVEDQHHIEIGAVIRCDFPISPGLEACVNAVGDALAVTLQNVNRANMSIFAEPEDAWLSIHVRSDTGGGDDRIYDDVIQQVTEAGGQVSVFTDADGGIDLEIRMLQPPTSTTTTEYADY